MKKVLSFTIIAFFSIFASYAQERYKDKTLTAQERAEDLVRRLTLEEKVGLMVDTSQPVERLGIKPYNWWNEALHGVARSGLATVFPQPIGIAATFDSNLVYNVFSAVSDEARAKNRQSTIQDSYKRYQGLTMWTPTVNIFRDPRWGRGIETYGEDPYLTSVMGVSVVKGLQGPGDSKYDKLHACAKHFAVHSGPEWNRHSFNAEKIPLRDLYETYLPPFKALVKEAGVKEVMCAYNRYEGEPCCGNRQLLMEILRKEWGFNGIVVSDCGAIADFYNEKGHQTHPDAATASSDAVLAGTDLECGSSYKSLIESVRQGLIREDDIDVSITRLMKARFELGEMDDHSDVPWTKIPYSVVASSSHDSLALEVARKSMTLLLNKNKALPLKKNIKKIAVMGPNANDSVMQWGNYNGTPKRTITILEGIRNALENRNELIYEKGCGLVERTLFKSTFSNCISDNGPGFSAQYWNNPEQAGEPVASDQITTPFNFITTGATVFAPGVNLTDFSSQYKSTFLPDEDGEIELDFYACGEVNLIINGVKAQGIRANHGARRMSHTMSVERGMSYDIQIDFRYTMGDAQLNFDLGYKENINIGKSIERIKDAEIVIFAGGISPALEGEEMGVNLPGFNRGDRTEIELPEVQREFIQALRDAGKKVIFVNCSGSPIAMETEVKNCEAILQAWYPGQSGGTAVAEVIFGDYNPAGRLPVTFYKNITQLPDFENYHMKGRTYRYMTEEPLFPFGYGLSYSSFQYGTPTIDKASIKVGEAITVTVPLSNLSKIDGDEVVQAYLRKENDSEGPAKTLRAFKRVYIPKGETKLVNILFSAEQFEWWNSTAARMEIQPGNYEILVGSSSHSRDLQKLNVIIQ